MKNLKIQRRKELRIKMAQVFNDEMQILPSEMRNIVLDDLITAFENRLRALQKCQMKTDIELLVANMERYEVLQIS